MKDYRLYFMSYCGLHIDRFEPIEAHGDLEAIEIAKLYTGRYPIELWWRDRKVQAFVARADRLPPSDQRT